MTFAASCGWSVLRSLLIAGVGLLIARRLQRFLARQDGPLRLLAWTLLLIPLFSPGLVVGYGYRNYALSLVHHPLLNELLYGVILAFHVLPVGVVLIHFAPPPPVSAEALHCYRLTRRRGSAAEPWHVILRGPLQNGLAAAALMFLVSFQEAEIAALMQAASWTEWVFTRQAALFDVRATLGYVGVIVLIELLFIVPVLVWLWRRFHVRGTAHTWGAPGVTSAWWLLLTVGVVVNAAVPGWFVLRGAWDGFAVLRAQPGFWRELLLALLYAGAAALLAGLTASVIGSRNPVSRRNRISETAGGVPLHRSGRFDVTRPAIGTACPAEAVPNVKSKRSPAGQAVARTTTASRTIRTLAACATGLALLPGLAGGLTLGLVLEGLFQHFRWFWAYDTPVGLLVALTLFLLPRVLLLQGCLWTGAGTSMLHTAHLLPPTGRRGELLWRIAGRPRFWGLVIIFFWAYLELSLADVLAPPGMEPVVKRLYNLMHFGHISGLAAMVCVTLAAPLLIIATVLLGRRVLWRWMPA